ncbi:hypothetical protein HB364_10195 [Pseudoflavitalea sp. X16]|uniref:hypothetical protein n=1 Tax=Paraflavitalea devenefica TaxID=2716334 RepID=UPI001423332F|nr:hypothetical protein [Paraflavitalea devenefica]NII25453.1 hypothetical protein [Paraflavitalea devenefica]
MFKRSFLLGLLAGVLAGVASLIYVRVYTSSLGADFSTVASTTSIIVGSVLGGVLAGVGYWLLNKLLKNKGEIVFNFLLTILSFASILAPLAARLPLDVEMPELFPGLTVPMHFFPALAWFTLKPLFIQQVTKNYDKPAGI